MMDLLFNQGITHIYKSNSQKIRVMTEDWVLQNIFCPNCGQPVNEYKNNKPVADFYCKKCIEDFELKSKNGNFSKKISAGAYSKMIERINSFEKPNFFFMGYRINTLSVKDFFVVPKHFFISEIIEKRKPLSETARRAGWVGANILFSKIPKAGRIFYIENGIEINKKLILEKWQKTLFLKQIKRTEEKGWILDIMNCIDALGKKEFSLEELYVFESDLQAMHPKNKHIKDKIRQQLQFLRDKDYIDFLGQGRYKLK